MSKPAVSIIIPAYNVTNDIDHCLESVINQTFTDIEIICIDDCSSDDTLQKLQTWEAGTKNFHLIKHTCNLSAARCRRDGVLQSTGEYIMFLDSDDYLEKEACEKAIQAIRDNGADIVQFGTIVENHANLPKSRIELNERLLRPYAGQIDGDLLQACFIDRTFGFTVWNKIYNGDICRRAFSRMGEHFFPKANDLYAAFFILYYANKYIGIEEKLYHYCFGKGMTGHNRISLSQFELCCKSTEVYHALRDFVREEGIKDGESILREIDNRLSNEQYGNLMQYVDAEDRLEAFQYLRKEKYGGDLFACICGLAVYQWDRKADAASFLKNIDEIRYRPRKTKNIAVYYRSIKNGGAQKVVASLASMLASSNEDYKVILITEEQPSEDDYEVHPSVIRAMIPDNEEYVKQKYPVRAKAISSLIDQYQIDLFISGMWSAQMTFWDLMIIKSHPRHPAYVSHTHSAAGVMWSYLGNEVKETWHSYSMMDAVVCLSEVDRVYWSMINRRVYNIPNIFPTQKAGDISQKSHNHNVLWVGRITEEKQPLEIVYIMQEVVKEVPDVCCRIVGTGDEELVNQLEYLIEEKGLENSIELCGFHKDVSQFYNSSSILLITSAYEGYSLTAIEAASWGTPIVMYDIPWLEVNKQFEGSILSVSQFDRKGAAHEIIQLLQEHEEWSKKSENIYHKYQSYAQTNILEDWLKVIQDIENQKNDYYVQEGIENTLLRELWYFHAMGIEGQRSRLRVLNGKLQRTYDEKAERGILINKLKTEKKELVKENKQLARKIKTLTREVNDIKESTSYHLGRGLTWPVRTIKEKAKGVQKEGN